MSGIPQNQIVNSIFKQHRRFQTLSRKFIPERLRRIARNVRNNNLVKPTIPAAIRNELIDEYKEDIKRLEKLIEKDLSVWMQKERS